MTDVTLDFLTRQNPNRSCGTQSHGCRQSCHDGIACREGVRMMPTEYTLEFLARQNAQILASIADVRDNYIILTGMVTRIEARMVAMETRMASLETSVYAMARQIDRIGDRVRKLEDAD